MLTTVMAQQGGMCSAVARSAIETCLAPEHLRQQVDDLITIVCNSILLGL